MIYSLYGKVHNCCFIKHDSISNYYKATKNKLFWLAEISISFQKNLIKKIKA